MIYKSQPLQSANLSVSQMKIAVSKLNRRVEQLKSFDVTTIRSRFDSSLNPLTLKINSTLEEIFGINTLDYQRYMVSEFDNMPITMGGNQLPISQIRAGYQESINDYIASLMALIEIFDEKITDASELAKYNIIIESIVSETKTLKQSATRKVFIVHGHNEGIKEALARLLTRLNLEPVILHEQPNGGKTLIEKFESHSTTVEYAVVIFTSDDRGYPANCPDSIKPRARQNVVLELGFFMGALGRNRVCVLMEDDIEIPSDYNGVLFLPLDKSGYWRNRLASEMKAAGIAIDMNNVY